MKKIFVLAALLFAFNMATHAQGNLQFNKVISGAANIGANTSMGLMTVPIGKVWKLEAVNSFSSNNPSYIEINGVDVSSQAAWCFPFWLSAGSTFDLVASPYAPLQSQYSIIEYNIVP